MASRFGILILQGGDREQCVIVAGEVHVLPYPALVEQHTLHPRTRRVFATGAGSSFGSAGYRRLLWCLWLDADHAYVAHAHM